MIRFLFALILATGLTAAERPAGFIGAGAGQNSQWQFDLGLVLDRVMAEHWGVHLGYVGRADSPATSASSYSTTQAPGVYQRVSQFGGLQGGGYYDAGRAWIAAGVENVTWQSQAVTVAPDHTYSTAQAVDKGGLGGYVKVGYKIGHISFYAAYGSQSKAMAGIALHL